MLKLAVIFYDNKSFPVGSAGDALRPIIWLNPHLLETLKTSVM